MMVRHVSGDKFENEYICQQKSHSNFQNGSPYEYSRWCVFNAYQYIHVIKLLFWVQIGQLKAITLICVLFRVPRDTLVKKCYLLRIDIYRTHVCIRHIQCFRFMFVLIFVFLYVNCVLTEGSWSFIILEYSCCSFCKTQM
jgi:hypothetical protein